MLILSEQSMHFGKQWCCGCIQEVTNVPDSLLVKVVGKQSRWLTWNRIIYNILTCKKDRNYIFYVVKNIMYNSRSTMYIDKVTVFLHLSISAQVSL